MKLLASTHFKISERKMLLRVFDVIFVWFSLYIASQNLNFTYFNLNANINFLIWLVTLGIYILVFGTVFEIYDLQKAESKKTIFKNLTLTTLLVTLLFLLTPVLSPSLPENRFQIFYFFIIVLSTLMIWRLFYIFLISSPHFFKRVILVGNQFDVDFIGNILLNNNLNYEIKGFVSLKEYQSSKFKFYRVENLQKVVKDNDINEIVVVSSYEDLNSKLCRALDPLLNSGFPINTYAHLYEYATHKVPIQGVEKEIYFYYTFNQNYQHRLYQLYRRIVDIMASVVGLAMGIIILPLIVIGNLIANRGCLFYKQVRLGKHGNKFRILKFRTMISNAERNGPQLARKKDKRVTAFGKFLRHTRLDEIPQFYNVLVGNMSLIGPRPERPEFIERLSKKIPFYEVRHVVMPGLTGWAQVNTRYANSEEDLIEKLQYDLYYIKHRSVFLDFRIIVKTISTVIFYRGQ